MVDKVDQCRHIAGSKPVLALNVTDDELGKAMADKLWSKSSR